MRASHELFVVAALLGQSVFAASGDFGAFDSFQFFQPPSFLSSKRRLSGGRHRITAGGGTTLPVTLQSGSITVNVPTERIWGWDYLQPILCGGADPISCGIFPIGTGGGVSVFSQVPF